MWRGTRRKSMHQNRNQDHFFADDSHNCLFATNTITILHLAITFIQIYCVNGKVPCSHCNLHSKRIFIFSGHSRHLAVPTEPVEVHTPENFINKNAHMQKDIQEFLPHFHILCGKKIGYVGDYFSFHRYPVFYSGKFNSKGTELHRRGVESRGYLGFLPTQAILRFYDSSC